MVRMSEVLEHLKPSGKVVYTDCRGTHISHFKILDAIAAVTGVPPGKLRLITLDDVMVRLGSEFYDLTIDKPELFLLPVIGVYYSDDREHCGVFAAWNADDVKVYPLHSVDCDSYRAIEPEFYNNNHHYTILSGEASEDVPKAVSAAYGELAAWLTSPHPLAQLYKRLRLVAQLILSGVEPAKAHQLAEQLIPQLPETSTAAATAAQEQQPKASLTIRIASITIPARLAPYKQQILNTILQLCRLNQDGTCTVDEERWKQTVSILQRLGVKIDYMVQRGESRRTTV